MAIASASDDRNTVITREVGIRGDAGTNGTNGIGFDVIRGGVLSAPIVHVLAPNFPAVAGFDALTFDRASTATGFNKYNQFAEAGLGIPRETALGWYIEGAGTNLLINTDTLATQDITVASQTHVLSFFGTGTVTLSGAFNGSLVGTGASDRVQLVFTSGTGALTVTVTGTVEYAQIEQSPFMSSHIRSGATPAVRAADIVSMTAFNNCPNLDDDFSVFLRVYFDGFTGGDDYILSLPSPNADAISLFCTNGLLTFRLSDGTTTVDATVTILANVQYNVAIRKSSSDMTLDVFGVGSNTQLHALTLSTDTDGIIKIGGKAANADDNMNGKMYDLRIYDTLLNDEEVQFLRAL